MFITAFTSTRQLSLPWASSIQSIPPHPTSSRYILILSFHLRLDLPSGLFPQVSHPKPCINLCSPNMCYMPRPSHSSRFDHPINNGWGVQIIKLLSMKFSPLTSYLVLLRPKYSPQHPILKQPPSMWATKFHIHTKQQEKIIVLNVLIFKILDSKLEDKRFCTEW